MKYDEFVDAAADRAGLSSDEAIVRTDAVRITLAERISGGEARDLASQLPQELQDPLLAADEPAEPFGLVEFVRRVGDRAGVDDIDALDGVRAVLGTIGQAITGGEFEDIMAQLPQEFRELVGPMPRRA
jgi:uncharacterized protein (DUF2267 family)